MADFVKVGERRKSPPLKAAGSIAKVPQTGLHPKLPPGQLEDRKERKEKEAFASFAFFAVNSIQLQRSQNFQVARPVIPPEGFVP